jgi:manganese/zinc/iron transport system permease protein
LETDAARRVDLDLDHALYGHLEAALWLQPTAWADLLGLEIWLTAPRPLQMLVPVAMLLALVLLLAFKELRIASFDPDYAALQGFRPRIIDFGLTAATTLAAVAAFEAVGSILVIALLTCPAAMARLCTDRLSAHIGLSIFFATAIAVAGYSGAAVLETGGSATMAATGGLAVALTVIVRRLRRQYAIPPAAAPGSGPDSAARPLRPESE